MRLIVRPDFDAVSEWAANHVARRVMKPRDRKSFVLGLPTGSSPLGMYKRLVALYRAGKVSFKDVVTFNMDEYLGLDAEHPQSYHRYMAEHFFDFVDIPPANRHILDGAAADPEAECAAYEAKIKEAGGIDLFVGGIGADGHIAFNEPGSSLASRTRVKTLTSETRQANSRFFCNDESAVPKAALTVGVGTIMDAKEVVILVSGRNKARALRHAIEEGVNHLWTVSCLQLHPRGLIVADEDATVELRVGTVKYFEEIESKNFENGI